MLKIPLQLFTAEVVLVYLYGSQATGLSGPLSDVDIAVLLNDKVKPTEYLDRQLIYMERLEPSFPGREVNVLILNEAPVLLKYEVIRYGKILYKRDELERIQFEVKATQEYFDTQRQREVNDYYLFRQIKAGEYGYRFRKYQQAIAQNAGRALHIEGIKPTGI